MSRCIYLCVVFFAAAAFTSNRAIAQSIVPNGAGGAAPSAARPSLKFGADYQLASWMAADLNLAQSLAEVARQKGGDSTREFAGQSYAIRDKWIESLKPFLGDDVKAVSTSPGADSQSTAAANVTTPVTSNNSGPIVSTSSGAAFDLVSLKRTLAEEALARTRQEWSKLSNDEFDRAYWNWEFRAGRRGVETLSVFREHGSPALQQVIDGMLPELKSRTQEVASRAKL